MTLHRPPPQPESCTLPEIPAPVELDEARQFLEQIIPMRGAG